MIETLSPRSRKLIFTALALSCLALAFGYVAWAAQRSGLARSGDPSILAVPVTDPDEMAATLQAEPHLIFQSTAVDGYSGSGYAGTAALMPLGAFDGPRLTTSLNCERIHYSAGSGICLQADALGTYSAHLFGPSFHVRRSWQLSGFPSRARVSPDGRYAASTVFVSGHSYADAQGFSTETVLYETATGTSLGDLEQFEITRDGEVIKSPDFNFWGVTFTRDSNRFYATLATGGNTYLIEGDVLSKRARVLRENVECPSLSPDNTRIAFKKLVGDRGSGAWRLYVLDLATMKEMQIAETRSIDDQVEWLDDTQLLYSRLDDLDPGPESLTGFNVMVVPADGTGSPRILLPSAYSPAVPR